MRLYQKRSNDVFMAKRILVHMGHRALVHPHQGGAPFPVFHYQRGAPMHHYKSGAPMFFGQNLIGAHGS